VCEVRCCGWRSGRQCRPSILFYQGLIPTTFPRDSHHHNNVFAKVIVKGPVAFVFGKNPFYGVPGLPSFHYNLICVLFGIVDFDVKISTSFITERFG